MKKRASAREEARFLKPLREMRTGVTERLDGDLLAELPQSPVPELAAMAALWEAELATRSGEGEAIEAMDLALLSLDAQGRLQRANPMAVRLFRYQNAGELVLEHASVVLPDPADLDWLLNAQGPTVTEQGAHESVAHRADGSAFQIELEVVERKQEGVLVRCIDITDKKALEAEMARARDIALHTAELQAQFLANMSHEIRTPVNGVLGMADALLDADLPDDARESAEIIRSCGHTLLALINDILDLSKLEAGRVSLESRPTNLRKLAQEVVTLLEPSAIERGDDIELDFPMHDSVPDTVEVDPVRIRQILLNLLGNAVKFTRSGSVCLRVRCHHLVARRGEFVFEVEDTGVGIPEDKLDQIFGRFVQAEKSTTRKFGGTGLGLPISKQLANLMGGDISVTSTPDGTLFRVVLPLTVVEAPTRVPRVSEPVLSTSGLRVLVAEDNVVNQRITTRILKKLGCSVRMVDNGADAAAEASSGRFDVVLMDCMMPDVDGYEATRRIREWERTRAGPAPLPVIALTARAMEGDRERCLEAGMDDYLSKPFSLAALRSALVRWSAGRPRVEFASALPSSPPPTASSAANC